MIRVEVGNQCSGRYWQNGAPFPFAVYGFDISGQSTEPLLYACRLLQDRVGPDQEIGLFDPGDNEWRLKTTVGYGAKLTVAEEPRCRFVSYRSIPKIWQREG